MSSTSPHFLADHRCETECSRSFTTTSVDFVLTILNATIDLISFSGILFRIYPPLFIALVTYAMGGTWLSVLIGRVSPLEVTLLYMTASLFSVLWD